MYKTILIYFCFFSLVFESVSLSSENLQKNLCDFATKFSNELLEDKFKKLSTKEIYDLIKCLNVTKSGYFFLLEILRSNLKKDKIKEIENNQKIIEKNVSKLRDILVSPFDGSVKIITPPTLPERDKWYNTVKDIRYKAIDAFNIIKDAKMTKLVIDQKTLLEKSNNFFPNYNYYFFIMPLDLFNHIKNPNTYFKFFETDLTEFFFFHSKEDRGFYKEGGFIDRVAIEKRFERICNDSRCKNSYIGYSGDTYYIPAMFSLKDIIKTMHYLQIESYFTTKVLDTFFSDTNRTYRDVLINLNYAVNASLVFESEIGRAPLSKNRFINIWNKTYILVIDKAGNRKIIQNRVQLESLHKEMALNEIAPRSEQLLGDAVADFNSKYEEILKRHCKDFKLTTEDIKQLFYREAIENIEAKDKWRIKGHGSDKVDVFREAYQKFIDGELDFKINFEGSGVDFIDSKDSSFLCSMYDDPALENECIENANLATSNFAVQFSFKWENDDGNIEAGAIELFDCGIVQPVNEKY